MTLLADVVATSAAVAATSKRSAKTAAIADLLRRLTTDEVAIVVGFLTGEPRQGRFGVGWATLAGVAGDGGDDGDDAVEPSLTVAEVDASLTTLAGTTGPGSTAVRQATLASLWARATADEGAFLFRLLTGELRQGALDGVMADAAALAASVPAPLMRRAAMFSGDLGATAVVALTAGADGLAGIGLSVLRPLQPMLAATSADVAAALAETGSASVEWKLDGARVQAHRVGSEVRLFTRNLNDVTARLPDVVAAVAGLPVEQVVLDGETIGIDDAGRPHAFQDTMSRFGAETGGRPVPLRGYFFDVLHVDGVDLVDRPLTERLDVLERIAGPYRIPAITTSDPDEAAAFAATALDAGHEGVMVKALGSPYEAGRRGGAWRKVKPVRTLDLVVLAAEWGHGRRTGWLSNLHLGARDPDGGFVMVGKTFKGLTDELLTWQTDVLQERAVDRPGWGVSVRPDLVVEVALDGVQSSTRYAGGVALRFARVRAYRPDKDAADADTIDTVRAMLP